MRLRGLLLAACLAVGCSNDPAADSSSADLPKSQSDEFFTSWLQEHGEKDIVIDEQGVGLKGNATRLLVKLYDAQPAEGGGFVVETEFRILLPSGEQVVEFLAGMGETEKQAIDDCLVNFVLTTFHVVYKCFMNPADEHQQTEQVTINGQPRSVTMGDFLLRGEVGQPQPEIESLRTQIRDAVAALELPPGPHWIKLVYSQAKSEPVVVAATLDNEDVTQFTEQIKNLPWPKQEGFYMAKQFIVVQ